MKKIMLLCDRCPADKPQDAIGAVRIGIIGMGRGKSFRLDVCEEHRAVIVGNLSVPNGAKPVPHAHAAIPRHIRRFKAGSLVEQAYNAILPLIAKHGRMDIDLITETTKMSDHAIGDALRALQGEGKLRRITMGVYAAAAAPEPPERDVTAAEQDIMKLVRHRPGLRSAYIAPLLGMSLPLYKRARENLKDAKKLRLKGTKAAAQAYPV